MVGKRVTATDKIKKVQNGLVHVVLLGAGASKAVCPNGDKNGNLVPLMNELFQLPNVQKMLKTSGIEPTDDFEKFFSHLYSIDPNSGLVKNLENSIFDYFRSLELPPNPTIYDQLILSLRGKDLLVAFNWDPFLLQAYARNLGKGELPDLVFLHGCVSLGYCKEHFKTGLLGMSCSVCNQLLTPTKLLYPIENKGYNSEPFLKHQWDYVQSKLSKAGIFTVFGYSAPNTDREAVELLVAAWKITAASSFARIEIVDIKNKTVLQEEWAKYSHHFHYDIYHDFKDTFLARHPRRSCEMIMSIGFDGDFVENNPFPASGSLEDYHAFLRPFFEYERNPRTT